ncbi:MAG TPA: hypothetical protein VE570_11310 [Thermoleophilaceae bacterium]|jgi:hypothetical protein|nr:hypothetical protein [Thermoleophilaceae bacterium]
MVGAPQLPDLREEGRRVIALAHERGVPVRLMGGVAVSLRCPSAARPPLVREYKDIDLAGLGSARREIVGLLLELGYLADEEFNALHGRTRLLFHDPRGRQLDVILDRFEMSHELDLRERLLLDAETLTPADLLLTKLQVVELNERDLKDAASLLHDHDSLDERVAGLLAGDWGWWRTATSNLDQLAQWVSTLAAFEQGTEWVQSRIRTLTRAIDDQPKSLRWKARAKVGERVRWYELPEEPEA